ncbi:MAG: pyridoxal-phosphate dependent enzyme, partial [Gammaproteobacteria bacterium]|nr:pyridoxal-phosphate dependent enzyme [candidate division Zixibacteria bacterium]NIR92599.1 pyridoxal-phosphate dependent enzyme [Gammaproteobacteria bacterium]NIR66809.1 pyridoxal-phosphate dependent enzyme [candidate division Zixibacteria bacterium]NIS48313.1 pyridoxal-phosphate dependent enzyme [candidate division Zixibacteria bacterium]NIT54132.1 pyridoxal-phosphate dependent enzyme [candidate division Zixibacteria bacterium]
YGAKMVITTGAVQSNHCRQTAASARKAGMECTLVLVGESPDRDSGNLFLDRVFGARVIYTDDENHDRVMDEVFDEAWQNGLRPYRIPYGGSSPTGASAYAYALFELLEQIDPPDYIVHATSSGGTQAGMLSGAAIADYSGKIIGISVSPGREELSETVHHLANEVCDLIEKHHRVNKKDIFVLDDYVGEGYGVMGAGEVEAIQLFADLEGMIVDPVYTGRCASGMIDLLRTGFFEKNSTILFWHTGGMPALFADNYQNLILDRLS